MGNSTPNVAGKFNLPFEYYLIVNCQFLRTKLNGFMFIIKIMTNKVCIIKNALH